VILQEIANAFFCIYEKRGRAIAVPALSRTIEEGLSRRQGIRGRGIEVPLRTGSRAPEALAGEGPVPLNPDETAAPLEEGKRALPPEGFPTWISCRDDLILVRQG